MISDLHTSLLFQRINLAGGPEFLPLLLDGLLLDLLLFLRLLGRLLGLLFLLLLR